MTCYLSSAFIICRLRLCVLKTLREDTRKKEEKHQFQTPFLTEDISHIEKQRVPRHATHQGHSCEFCLCALETLGGATRMKGRENIRWPIFRRHF